MTLFRQVPFCKWTTQYNNHSWFCIDTNSMFGKNGGILMEAIPRERERDLWSVDFDSLHN